MRTFIQFLWITILFLSAPAHAMQPPTANKQTNIEINNQLLVAAGRGNQTKVANLIAAGANVNYEYEYNDTRYTALLRATMEGHAHVSRMLIENGADVNHISGKHNWSLLMSAARKGSSEITQMLIKNGADVNYISKDEYTALHFAVVFGHLNVVHLLIKNGANIHLRVKGKTILQLAEAGYHIVAHGDHLSLLKFCISVMLRRPTPAQSKRLKTFLCYIRSQFGRDIPTLFKKPLLELIATEHREKFTKSRAYQEITKLKTKELKNGLIQEFSLQKEETGCLIQ